MTFTMWSLGHILMILAPIVFTVLLHYLTRNYDYEKKRQLGIKLSWIAVHILFLRNIEIFIIRGYEFDVELVPLQICHFANFVLLFAFMKDNKTAFGLAFTLNLLAAYLSILFADGLQNYSSILNFRGQAYIWGHIIIVVITAWAFMNNFVVLTKKIYVRTLKLIGVLYVSSLFFNNLFGMFTEKYSNYFYTNHPEKGTPLEWFWNWGTEIDLGGFKFNIIYLIGTAAFGFFITFLLYLLANKLKPTKSE